MRASDLLLERHENMATELRKYADDPAIYVSFSDLLKVGINPTYEYDTPAGIYAYPLQPVWDVLVADRLPYAGDRKYVHVYRASDNIKDVSDYTRADLTRDLKILHEKYAGFVPATTRRLFPPKDLENMAMKMFKRDFWDLTKKSDIEAVVRELNKKSDIEAAENISDPFVTYITQWQRDAYEQTPWFHFWNITRNLGILVAKQRRSKPSGAWNAILRSLGYEGFSDLKGRGAIHKNEPYQALFLSTKPIQYVATVENVRKFHGELINIPWLSDLTLYLTATKEMPWSRQLRIGSYVAQEWEHLLDYGYSKHLEIPDLSKFNKTMVPDWDGFCQALIARDFNNFPKLAMQVEYHDALSRSSSVTDTLLAVQPKNMDQARLYANTVIGTKFLYHICDMETLKAEETREFEQLLVTKEPINVSEVEEEAKRHAIIRALIHLLHFIPKGDAQTRFKALKSEIGKHWYIVTGVIPENEILAWLDKTSHNKGTS